MRYIFLILFIVFPTKFLNATCTGVGCSCTVSATGVAFGTYTPTSSSPLTATGSVTVHCTGLGVISVSYAVALSKGQSTTFTPRFMSNGIDHLNYNIYTTNAHAQVWGDSTGGTVTQSASHTLVTTVNDVYTTYGQATALQNVTVGSYTDTITVTVTY